MTIEEIENHIMNLEENQSNLGVKQSELCGKNEEDIRDAERKLMEANSIIDGLSVNNAEMLYQICLLQLGMDADIEIQEEGGGEDGL